MTAPNQSFPPPAAKGGGPTAPVVINEGKRNRLPYLGTVLLLLVVGGGGLEEAARGRIVGGANTGGYVLGGVFALIGVIALLLAPVALRPHGYVFDADGVAYWEGRTRRRWQALWRDMSAVALSVTRPRYGKVPRAPASTKAPTKVTDPSRVVLRGTPHDERYPQWHPNVPWAHGEMWLDFGMASRYRPAVEEGVRRFAGPRYHGEVPVDAPGTPAAEQ